MWARGGHAGVRGQGEGIQGPVVWVVGYRIMDYARDYPGRWFLRRILSCGGDNRVQGPAIWGLRFLLIFIFILFTIPYIYIYMCVCVCVLEFVC